MSGPFRDGTHLMPTSRMWPDEDIGPWLLTFKWQVLNGRAECIGLDISSALSPAEIEQRFPGFKHLPDLGRPLTTGVLRSLKLSELVADERYRAAHLVGDLMGSPDEGAGYTSSAPRMRAATRVRLERTAEAYRAAWAKGEPPRKAVAKRLGISEGAAANLVLRAREAGLLPPTSQGAPQG